jgi:hypothetical protein
MTKDVSARERSLRGVFSVATTALMMVGLLACEAPDRTTTPVTSTPCGGAQIPLANARESAAHELVQPDAPLANAESLASVYQCSTVAGGFLLLYQSGVGVLESPNTLKDPAAEWEGLADSYKEFSVGQINGVPASFADPAIDEAIGGVDFVVGDVRYTVSGDGTIPLDDLISVAQSLPVDSTT